jgi:hypothetical protein
MNTPTVSNASVSQSVLNIAKGGTNANNLESAQANLGKTNMLDLDASDDQFPSSKAVYDYINFMTSEKVTALTQSGYILAEKPDNSWTVLGKISDSTTPYSWSSFAYGNGLYMAVADHNKLGWYATSKNGITWSEIKQLPAGFTEANPVAGAVNSIIFANGKFIISGAQGYISTTTDAVNFVEPTTPAPYSYYWFKLQYINNAVWAVGGNGRFYTHSSDGGVTWSQIARICPDQQGSNRWAAYGNGITIVTGDGGAGILSISPDNGASWNCPSFTPFDGFATQGMQFFQGNFWVVNYTNGDIYKSSDGTTWTNSTIHLENFENTANGAAPGIIYIFNNRLVIFQPKTDVTTKNIWTTTDGVNFTHTTIAVAGNIVNSVLAG